MTDPIIISDAGPLISYDRAGLLHLYPSLYGKVVIPPTGRVEIGELFQPDRMLVRAPVHRLNRRPGAYDQAAA